MNESISLMKFNSKASSKQKIISILSEQWPLSSKEIFEKLKREYSHEISYQGVHKSVLELTEENIIQRDGSKYKLNTEWLLENRKFFEKTQQNYKENREKVDPNFEGTITFEFDNYSKCMVWLAELFSSRVLDTRGEKTLIGLLKYGWWPLNFKFEDFLLLMKMMGQRTNGYPIIKIKTPFGEWIMEQYKKAGAKGWAFDEKLELKNNIVIQGDFILEIEFEPEFEEYIMKTYSQLHTLEDLLKFYITKKEPKTKIKVKITKNPTLAALMEKQIMEKYF